jgi:hypothetical protein
MSLFFSPLPPDPVDARFQSVDSVAFLINFTVTFTEKKKRERERDYF